jgi:hypothetical protein
VDRRRFLLTSVAGALSAPLSAEAQQVGKVYRVGMLLAGERRAYESRLHDHYRRPGYWTYPPETWGLLRRPAA